MASAPPARQARTRPSQGELTSRLLETSPNPHKIVDIANLADRSFEKDRAGVLARAARVGVSPIIASGCCLRTSRLARGLAAADGPVPVYFTAGVHPHNANSCDADTLAQLRELAGDARCVALGECGLDYNRNFSPPAAQRQAFAAQLGLARELGKPLFLHCREAGGDFARLVREHASGVPGLLHCFTGSRQELEEGLDLGLHVGITGWVCDARPERGGALAPLVPLIPDDRLLIETDAPYLTPRPAGAGGTWPRRNEPALLPFVLAAVADCRGQSIDHVARITYANAARLFGLPDG